MSFYSIFTKKISFGSNIAERKEPLPEEDDSKASDVEEVKTEPESEPEPKSEPAPKNVTFEPTIPSRVEVPEEFDCDTLLKILVENGGSDLHISVGDVPIFRISGVLHRSTAPRLEQEKTQQILYSIISEDKIREFESCGNLDFAYAIDGLARFRGNFFKQKNGIAAVFRQIPDRIPTIDEMKLPQILKKIAMFKRGIVVVTGPTGSGKSTTLAAMIDHINKNRSAHIITVEDPIEFSHKNDRCIIDHREVGTHATSFAGALKACLREDPDVVLVGEMRDLDTIYNAIRAAETGALVFGTLHTNSAAKTIDRMIDVFPAKQQASIRAMLSESMRAIIAQLLLPKKYGQGRVAVHEVLIAEAGFSNLIREGKTSQIGNYMQTGRNSGMQTMDANLLKLLQEGVITVDTAREVCHDPSSFKSYGYDLSL